MNPSPVTRKRLTTALVLVLCLSAGVLVGDRFLPFRGTNANYSYDCDGIFSTIDMGFIPQITLAGRRIVSEASDESGRGDDYHYTCKLYGDEEVDLVAWGTADQYDTKGWQANLADRELLQGQVRPLRVTDSVQSDGPAIVALSADSSAAMHIPCKMLGDDVYLSLTVKAPGASDGNADDQRLTIAAITSRFAAHSINEAGCLEPSLPDESPTFAS